MAWIWAMISAIIFVYLLQKLLSPNNSKRRLPPGPKGLPLLGHLHLMGKNPHRSLRDLARKHGPIMGLRLGLKPVVVMSSPATAELVLKTHDLVFASRPPNEASRLLSYDQRNLVFAPYGPYWRNMRKICSFQLLSSAKTNRFVPMRKAEVALMVSSLRQAAESREIVDVTARIAAVNSDMNCLMILGSKYSDKDGLDKAGLKGMIMELMEVGAQFNLADYFPYIGALDLQGLNRRVKRLSNLLDPFLEKIIDDHVQNKKQTEDFVDTIMAIMESPEAGFKLDRRHIKAVLQDLLITGMDTSATATEWAISELMKHPSIMKKLHKELEAVVGLDKMVEESHLDKLEYLDCVVKETLRLHPVAPLLIPHESVEDCELQGFHVPKKATIIVNVWAIGRDPNVWPDPESFTPERFIGSDIDMRGGHFQLIPFGSGRRGCPGLQLGITLTKLVLAQLVHCFDWELPKGMEPGDVDMSEHVGVVTARAKPLLAMPNYRLHLT